MLMDMLGIILAFSTIMMLFGLLVTTVVHFIQRIGLWREKILEKCLAQFSSYLNQKIVNTEQALVLDASEMLKPVAIAPKKIKYFNYQHTNITEQQIQDYFEDAVSNLADVGKYQKQQLIADHKKLLHQKFERFEHEMTALFTRRTHISSFIVALVIALAFQLNTFDIFAKISMDPQFRQQLVQIAENSVTNKEGPCKKLEPVATFKLQRDKVMADIKIKNASNPKYAEISTLKVESLDNLEDINEAVSEIFKGNPERADKLNKDINEQFNELNENHKKWLEQCFLNNYQSLSKLGFQLIPNGWQYYFNGDKYMAERSDWLAVIYAWLGMLVSAIFISLGGPFWFDRIKDLVKLRETVQAKK